MRQYNLIRSKRRTLALYVRDGAVEVRSPLRLNKTDIDRFVESKEAWISEKLAQMDEIAAQRESFSLNYGSEVTYRGKRYPIAAKEGRRADFDGARFYMPPSLDAGQIKQTCIQVYKMLAKQCLTEKTREYGEKFDATPAAVKVNSALTRWGSCSAGKNINFSWRLVMAGDDVIDYVVVHELAHLLEMNHSARFWAIVEGVFPDYKERRKRLKDLQARLAGEWWG